MALASIAPAEILTAQSATDNRPLAPAVQAGTKRPVCADSSDQEEEAGDELPASGLVAPWEVLRGLADVAIERAAIVRPDECAY